MLIRALRALVWVIGARHVSLGSPGKCVWGQCRGLVGAGARGGLSGLAREVSNVAAFLGKMGVEAPPRCRMRRPGGAAKPRVRVEALPRCRLRRPGGAAKPRVRVEALPRCRMRRPGGAVKPRVRVEVLPRCRMRRHGGAANRVCAGSEQYCCLFRASWVRGAGPA